MRKVIWRNRNHMQINTGHKGFDRQCECLGTGNVWGTCQFSNYIRSYNETECNGFINLPGHLQKWDLDRFKDIPSHVRRGVEELTAQTGGILYEIRHFGIRQPYSGKQKIVHGYVLTARHDSAIPYRHLKTWMVRNGVKSNQIMAVVREYVSEEK